MDCRVKPGNDEDEKIPDFAGASSGLSLLESNLR
jgi:hypothetical protein